MRLPVRTDALTLIATGDPMPVLVYGTQDPKTDAQGNALYKVPILIMGTGDRTDPTSYVTIPGPLPEIQRGPLRLRNLTISTWTMRGKDGNDLSGTTLRADSVEPGSEA